MVTVACVQTTNYLGRGAQYVRKLFDGCRKWLPGARYVCLTDDPTTVPDGVESILLPSGLRGWWNKLFLFHPNTFTPGERVLYFDLDTLIVGDIAEIASYAGTYAMTRDMFNPNSVASAVMAWEAGKADHIWTIWEGAGRPEVPGGDQKWIEFLRPSKDILDDLYPRQFVSFKKDCFRQGRVPSGTRVLMFHGEPRPHDAALVLPWIDKLWNQTPLGG